MIAGEASGDLHGAGVVRELRKRDPQMEIFGIGGDKMAKEGMSLVYHVRETSFMGFVEVLKHLPLIRSIERTLGQLLTMKRPDVVVLIDYPGFNLRFARIAQEKGIKVVYYISPQVWAWKKGRVQKMKGTIDRMCVVFPFEVPIYEKEGIPVRFVGHPLVEELTGMMEEGAFRKRFGLPDEKPFIAVVPGSRVQEIEKLFSVMVRAAALVAGNEKEVVVAVAPNLSMDLYQQHCPPEIRVTYVQHATHEVMKYAEFAFVTSGTATLETACLGTPMVVVYRTSPATYWIARTVVKIKHISLVNIVAGKEVVPEMVQGDATVDRLAQKANEILGSPERLDTMKHGLMEVRALLGSSGASANVADAVMSV